MKGLHCQQLDRWCARNPGRILKRLPNWRPVWISLYISQGCTSKYTSPERPATIALLLLLFQRTTQEYGQKDLARQQTNLFYQHLYSAFNYRSSSCPYNSHAYMALNCVTRHWNVHRIILAFNSGWTAFSTKTLSFFSCFHGLTLN